VFTRGPLQMIVVGRFKRRQNPRAICKRARKYEGLSGNFCRDNIFSAACVRRRGRADTPNPSAFYRETPRERLPQCGRTSKSTDIQLQKASSATAQLFFDVTAKNAVASW